MVFGYIYLEFNFYLMYMFVKVLLLCKIKIDKVDVKIILSMLGFVDYKILYIRFYYINELK